MQALEVSDLFTSVQGEGTRRGVPSVFVRLRRCNLACTWCDTKYTWDQSAPGYNEFIRYTPQQLADAVRFELSHASYGMQEAVAYYRSSVPLRKPTNLVITGGEPLLWKPLLEEFIPLVSPLFSTIEVETNGTVMPFTRSFGREHQVWYNLSPKLPNSQNGTRETLVPLVWREMAGTGHATVKLVVEGNQDVVDITWTATALQAAGFSRGSILLMAQGQTKEEQDERTPTVRSIADDLGLGFTTRDHVAIWGAKRGV